MVLLIVDTQKMIMTNFLYAFDTFSQNVIDLINEARNNKIEVIFVRHDDGTVLTKGVDGFEIYDSFAPRADEKIFDKYVNSAFRNTGLKDYLRNKNENDIVIAGLQTEYCIDATIKCGFEHGFHMIVPDHCNTTEDNEFMSGEASYNYYNNKIWNRRYAECVSMEEVLLLLQKNKAFD